MRDAVVVGRRRLAGEEARQPCVGLEGAFAGKPAPTGLRDAPAWVGAGLLGKRPPALCRA
ncbi:hypothetical protein FCI59_27760 [Pseudomonas protegens]|nr:hypothetical protein [Pseudomonas protegens]